MLNNTYDIIDFFSKTWEEIRIAPDTKYYNSIKENPTPQINMANLTIKRKKPIARKKKKTKTTLEPVPIKTEEELIKDAMTENDYYLDRKVLEISDIAFYEAKITDSNGDENRDCIYGLRNMDIMQDSNFISKIRKFEFQNTVRIGVETFTNAKILPERKRFIREYTLSVGSSLEIANASSYNQKRTATLKLDCISIEGKPCIVAKMQIGSQTIQYNSETEEKFNNAIKIFFKNNIIMPDLTCVTVIDDIKSYKTEVDMAVNLLNFTECGKTLLSSVKQKDDTASTLQCKPSTGHQLAR